MPSIMYIYHPSFIFNIDHASLSSTMYIDPRGHSMCTNGAYGGVTAMLRAWGCSLRLYPSPFYRSGVLAYGYVAAMRHSLTAHTFRCKFVVSLSALLRNARVCLRHIISLMFGELPNDAGNLFFLSINCSWGHRGEHVL